MIQIKFKNLEKSELAQEAAAERVEALVGKFEELKDSRITVTLEMENSPTQAGLDVFNVKLHIARGRFDGTTVTKSHSNLYVALADLMDHMLEKLNRTGDRARVKERRKARQLARMSLEEQKIE